ncbi:2-amino-4-hydroxy-6-hydroxymethyldihydropteridine diphosphokinase [Aquabacter sp. L1I39]|uniref:2-amino-4-hydroxy-6- hydroxymethyldihydropteridine diphosphokinase n=1 Tax=Aquabacter sp. L1I39 TaxID=2820278 RepID=UPI001ADC2FB4|nr:2-amino-4-hydroxy-6-hydroxymethyldihydropteridine diphosphokinase [Aquabacter sp. L1I39]QTL02364.1 2-amino-4-hydroxy-6-hydroxymethyldihydropteridine diphosphokinase [Aquabacter sp. L1I39]
MTSRAFLCLGANMGDARGTLALARGLLARSGLTVLRQSSLYRTPPWGPVPQDDYLNQVIEVASPVDARALLHVALRVERMLGRDRSRETRYGPRPIDIDILAFGRERHAAPDLHLPHPRLMERAFALVPLAEIAPDFTVEGVKVRDALARLDPSGIVRVCGHQ